MSKIHLALEKAEKKREEELKKKASGSLPLQSPPEADRTANLQTVDLEHLKIDKSLVALYQPYLFRRNSSENCGRTFYA